MQRLILWLALFALIPTSCSPAPTKIPVPSAMPLSSATATDSRTPTPTTTPTITPTTTTTPIPTIMVGDLTVPDPRYTNPEQFDLSNPDAHIPQFVNAMKMAGIEVSGNRLAENLTYETHQNEKEEIWIYARTASTGNEFSDGIALLIARQNPSAGEWKWEVAQAGAYWQSYDKYIGLYMDGFETKTSPFPSLALEHFGNGGILALRGQARPGPDIEERKPTNSASVRSFEMADRGNMALLFHYVVEPGKYPGYVTSQNVDEWLETRLSEIAKLAKQYKSDYPIFLVYNEPWYSVETEWNPEREPLRNLYGNLFLEEFEYKSLRIFIDEGLVPNRDFVILINDDLPFVAGKTEITHPVLTEARTNAFERLMSKEKYRDFLAQARLTSPETLNILYGAQMNKRDYEMGHTSEVGNLANDYADLGGMIMTEYGFFLRDQMELGKEIDTLVQILKFSPNIKGLLFFYVFAKPSDEGDQYGLPTSFFNEQDNPNFLYYQLLR